MHLLYESSPFDDLHSSVHNNIIKNQSFNAIENKLCLGFYENIIFQDIRTLRKRNIHNPIVEFTSELNKTLINNNDDDIPEEANKYMNESLNKIFGKKSLSKIYQVIDIINNENKIYDISDLKPLTIVNKTNRPFIFGDSPVVTSNIYLQSRSEDLSITTKSFQGVIIFYPITPKLLVLLYDPESYKVNNHIDDVINLYNKQDIDNINKLQIYDSVNSIYFNDFRFAEYVYRLWDEERDLFSSRMDTELVNVPVITLDGYETGEKALAIKEQPPCYVLTLSFLSVCNTVDNEYCFPYREQYYKTMNL